MSERCALCPGVNRCISPHGPLDRGGILFCGEAPGKSEDIKGIPFIGKTGLEVDNHYLPLANLKRREVTFTNSISCFPTTSGGKLSADAPKDIALLRSCAETNLYPLIERMQPRVIIPMGAFACRAIYDDVDLELQHGHPMKTRWGIPAFPMYHPALGLYEPKKMLMIRTDWHRLRKYLNGTLEIPVDLYPSPDYAEVEDPDELWSLDPSIPLAGDTESGREGPFCFTYSQQPGTGRLVRADREDLLAVLREILPLWQAPILFHNWPYDWPIMEAMNLPVPVKWMRDTMALVYHLGNLPQGLKALAWRELGMVMQDFEDLVKPYSSQRVIDYYQRASDITWPKPEVQSVRDPKTGSWKLYKAHSLNTKLKVFWTYLRKNPDKDVFAAWDNWEGEQAMVEEQLGPWPGMDIRHVPFEKVLHYACRDPDATLRLYHLIRRMAPIVRRWSQEWWVEKAMVAA